MNAQQTSLYFIPEENFSDFQKKIKVFNKKACKLNLPEVIIHQPFSTNNIESRIHPVSKILEKRKVRRHAVALTWEYLIDEAYTFVGTLSYEHSSPVVTQIGHYSIPTAFIESANGQCDHCKTNRRRKQNYIIKDQSDNLLIIGKQCLNDFFNHQNAIHIADLMSSFYKVQDELLDQEPLSFSSEWGMASLSYLNYAAMAIRLYGYHSKKDSNYAECTSEVAYHLMLNNEGLSPEDTQLAESVVGWLNQKNDDNDYMRHLKIIIKDGFFIPRTESGLLASALASYYKETKYQAVLNEEKKSTWFGDLKKRYDIKVKIVSKKIYDNAFGGGFLYKMTDESGNIYKWFCSGKQLPESDGLLLIKGTVKNHETFNGVKYTLLNRVAVVNDMAL